MLVVFLLIILCYYCTYTICAVSTCIMGYCGNHPWNSTNYSCFCRSRASENRPQHKIRSNRGRQLAGFRPRVSST